MLTLFRCNLHCKRPVRPYASHYRQNLANTTEPSVCGGDAALCKITLTTCCSGLHSSVASLQTHLDGQTAYIPGPAGGRFMSDRIWFSQLLRGRPAGRFQLPPRRSRPSEMSIWRRSASCKGLSTRSMHWLCALRQSDGEIGTSNFHVMSTIAPPNTENSLIIMIMIIITVDLYSAFL